jgi:hypothetical protein
MGCLTDICHRPLDSGHVLWPWAFARDGGPTSGSAGLLIRSGGIKEGRPFFVVSGQDIWNRLLSEVVALALLHPELGYLPRDPTNIECQYFKRVPPVP